MNDTSRSCTRCKETRPLEAFPLRSDTRRQSWCKYCMNEHRRTTRNNPVQRCYEVARYLMYQIHHAPTDRERIDKALKRIARESRNWPTQGITVTGGVVWIEDGKVRVRRAR